MFKKVDVYVYFSSVRLYVGHVAWVCFLLSFLSIYVFIYLSYSESMLLIALDFFF